MNKEPTLRQALERFIKTTRLSITEVGRLAEDPETGKAMTTNTIRTVLKGGPYQPETEERLRRAMRDYIEDVSALGDQDSEEHERAAERVRRRRRN